MVNGVGRHGVHFGQARCRSQAEQGVAGDGLQRPLFDEMCSLTTPVTASPVSENELFSRQNQE
jgi:hypothetical protein